VEKVAKSVFVDIPLAGEIPDKTFPDLVDAVGAEKLMRCHGCVVFGYDSM